MSGCMFNSDYECGVNPKGGCIMCEQFRELDHFILDESEYHMQGEGDGNIFIDGAIFRRLVDDYLKDFKNKKVVRR